MNLQAYHIVGTQTIPRYYKIYVPMGFKAEQQTTLTIGRKRTFLYLEMIGL